MRKIQKLAQFLIVPIGLILIGGCQEEPTQQNCLESNQDSTTTISPADSIVDTLDTINEAQQTIGQADETINPNDLVKDWEHGDFILYCESDYHAEELVYFIEYEREQWLNITSPFRATYTGNEFGDYFHITFEDDTNHYYDFGFGNNDFGEYTLFEEDGHYNDNPEFLNQEFIVYWEWRKSSFPCCSGEYYSAEAYLPSIVKLELADE